MSPKGGPFWPHPKPGSEIRHENPVAIVFHHPSGADPQLSLHSQFQMAGSGRGRGSHDRPWSHHLLCGHRVAAPFSAARTGRFFPARPCRRGAFFRTVRGAPPLAPVCLSDTRGTFHGRAPAIFRAFHPLLRHGRHGLHDQGLPLPGRTHRTRSAPHQGRYVHPDHRLGRKCGT